MAKTSWFVGGTKHQVKKRHRLSTATIRSISYDSRLTTTPTGAAFGGPDPEQERDPPPEPTPVTFPPHEPWTGHIWSDNGRPPDFQSLFCRIVKPSDVTVDHLQALNVSVQPTCSFQELVPKAPDGISYFEPPIPESTPDNEEVVEDQAKQAREAMTRKRKDFDDRLAELSIDNDLAFRVLSKRVPSGVKPPRIAFMRKFYEGLESMSQYWDCSLDHYFVADDGDRGEDGEKQAKRQRMDDGFSPRDSPNEAPSNSKQSLPIRRSSPGDDTVELSTSESNPDIGTGQSEEHARNIRSSTASPEPQLRQRYKGRRTGTGRDMPDQFRTDTVRNFVEGTVWAFHAALSTPRVAPIVQFSKLNIPVRLTASAYRMPKDRTKARQGWQEGPILSLQVRSETEFLDQNGEPKTVMVRLDQLRETAALLQSAQERRRQGRTLVRPGEGKWWTTTPRWGGGEGGDAQNDIGNTDILQAAEEMVGAAKDKERKDRDGRRTAMKKTPAMLWKELKAGRGNWDPKTDYTAIGKEPGSEWDQVFLISALNHHISVLKLTIHGAYVDYLTSGAMPKPLPEDEEWARPKLQRTSWFDLFDVNQRVEAFKGLWGVMAYLTREVEASA